MKWTIHELIKKQSTDNEFEGTIDFSDQLENTDILGISKVEVVGDYEIYDQEEFIFYIDIKCTLTMSCAITLKEVIVHLDFSAEEIFTQNKNDDFNMIEGITIDLLPIIWSNIILEKPMRVLSENAYDGFEMKNVEIEKDSNEVFSKLKNYKN